MASEPIRKYLGVFNNDEFVAFLSNKITCFSVLTMLIVLVQ